jgi:hypothetical protein
MFVGQEMWPAQLDKHLQVVRCLQEEKERFGPLCGHLVPYSLLWWWCLLCVFGGDVFDMKVLLCGMAMCLFEGVFDFLRLYVGPQVGLELGQVMWHRKVGVERRQKGLGERSCMTWREGPRILATSLYQ